MQEVSLNLCMSYNPTTLLHKRCGKNSVDVREQCHFCKKRKRILSVAQKLQSALSAKYPGEDLFLSAANEAQKAAGLCCQWGIIIGQSTKRADTRGHRESHFEDEVFEEVLFARPLMSYLPEHPKEESGYNGISFAEAQVRSTKRENRTRVSRHIRLAKRM
jgi:hypothetical protein